VPADRFFEAAPEVLKSLKERVAKNALELARDGVPKKPFYLTGQVGGKAFSVHAAGERVYMTSEEKGREEVELMGPGEKESLPEPVAAGAEMGGPGEAGSEQPSPPGVSPLDELAASLESEGDEAGAAGGGQ
jgi:hypothetical protein